MDVFFPAFLELPGSDTLPVPEVNFPGPRPTLEARESPPLSERKLLDRGPSAMFSMIDQTMLFLFLLNTVGAVLKRCD